MFKQMANAFVCRMRTVPRKTNVLEAGWLSPSRVAGSEIHNILFGHCCRAKLSGLTSPVAYIPPYHSAAPHIAMETSTKGQPRAGPFSQLQTTKEQCPKQIRNNTRPVFVMPRLQLQL